MSVQIFLLSERVDVFLSKNAMISFDGLKFLASQSSTLFQKCIYSKFKSSHKFSYSINQKKSMEKNFITNDEQLLDFINSLVSLVEVCNTNQLMLKNILVDKKYVFSENGLYQFIYLPIERSNDISVKKFLLKFLKSVQYESERYSQIIKAIKRSSSENCIKNISCLICEHKKSKVNKKAFSDYDALCLSNENECETSILSPKNLMNCTDNNGSIETTLLLKDKQAYDQETSILANNSFECDSYSDETNILNKSTANEICIEKESTNRALIIDMPYLKKIDNGEIIYITKPIFIIGKDSGISDYSINNASISRNHASILCEADGCYVVDNNSTNGTIVEGVRISPHERIEVFDGTIITFSDETFQFFKRKR